ncbi:C40 family peptidase [Calidifontibacter terrae]
MKTIARRSASLITALTLSAGIAVGSADLASATPTPVSNLHSTSCPAWIQSGQTSGCVTRLQQLLNTKENAGLAVDGIFGAATVNAVKKWQSAHGLVADGIVGAATKNSIDPVPTTSRNQAIVNAANSALAGTKYLYTWGGGHGATAGVATRGKQNAAGTVYGYGFDCSGFARLVYGRAFGYDKLGSGTSANQSTKGVITTSPQPGDLVFFSRAYKSAGWTSVKNNVGHVAVYLGGGMVAQESNYGHVQNKASVASAGSTYVTTFYEHFSG